MMQSRRYYAPLICKFDKKCDGRCLKLKSHFNHSNRTYCLDIHCSDTNCKKNHLLSAKDIEKHDILLYVYIILDIYDDNFIKKLISDYIHTSNILILSIQDRFNKIMIEKQIKTDKHIKEIEEYENFLLEREKCKQEDITILRQHRIRAFININKNLEDMLNDIKLRINKESIYSIIINFLGE